MKARKDELAQAKEVKKKLKFLVKQELQAKDSEIKQFNQELITGNSQLR